MKIFSSFLLGLILLFSINAKAHTYWVTTEGSHRVNEWVKIKIYFGEYVTGELLSGKALDKIKDIKILVRISGEADNFIEMVQDTGFWEGSFVPHKEGSYEIIGLNNTREVQDWTKHGFGIVRPVQYLKHVYQVGNLATQQSSSAFFDITLNQLNDSIYSGKIFKNNSVAAHCKFFISTPNGDETAYETDQHGNYTFTATKPGLYLIGIDWIDNTKAVFKGKPYNSTRHRMDASINVE